MDAPKRHDVRDWFAFAAVLSLALALRLARLERNGVGTPYYAAAVRSMAMSWHNLLFAAFDPAGFLAIDKPPVAFWLQTASVALFGFNGIALHVPQVLEGVVSVALLWHLVRPHFGPRAGLLAALCLAVTPISVAVDRSNNTDPCLVLVQLLAAWPIMLAAERASLPLLLLAAAIVGVGFNVKMAAALLVLPGFIALYAATAPASWRRRVGHLAAAAIVLTGVSLSWPLTVELTPPNQRPFIDSTSTNSMLELAVGHNAFDRFVRPDWLAIALPPAMADQREVPAGPFRLADPLLASQVAWLAPLALAGLWFAGWRDRLLWGGWALVCGVVFSAAGGIFIPYYLAEIAPPLAALAAIGLIAPRPARRFAMLLALSAVWQIWIIWGDSVIWRGWLVAIPCAAALAAAVPLLTGSRGIAATSRAFCVAALLTTPLTWACGPIVMRGNPTRPVARLPEAGLATLTAAAARRIGDGLGNRARLLGFLARNRGATRFALASTSILEASTMIVRTGEPVLALGGYTGTTSILSPDDLARRIAAGELRYILLGGAAAADPASPLHPLIDWIKSHGLAIDPARWRPPVPRGTDPLAQRRAIYLAGLALYDMAPD